MSDKECMKSIQPCIFSTSYTRHNQSCISCVTICFYSIVSIIIYECQNVFSQVYYHLGTSVCLLVIVFIIIYEVDYVFNHSISANECEHFLISVARFRRLSFFRSHLSSSVKNNICSFIFMIAYTYSFTVFVHEGYGTPPAQLTPFPPPLPPPSPPLTLPSPPPSPPTPPYHFILYIQ